MASVPQFVNTPRIASVNFGTANTAIDGSGTITEVIAGAAGGTRVLEIIVNAAASTAAGRVHLFLTVNSGTNWRIFDSVIITAANVSATVSPYRLSRSYSNLLLADSTHRIGFTTTISQSINVIALGGNLV
jgi:hypothetical protein